MPIEKKLKLQVALDYMLSYGIALLIITIAIAVIYKLGVFNPTITSNFCTPAPGFSCDFYNVNSTGVATIKFTQALGGPITVTGLACSTNANDTGDSPKYGNIKVTANSAFYPVSEPLAPKLKNGITVYSGNSLSITMNCYSSSGQINAQLGSTFFGAFWINYSVPYYGNSIQKFESITSRYT